MSGVLEEMRAKEKSDKAAMVNDSYRLAQQTAIVRLGMRRRWTIPAEGHDYPNRQTRRANASRARSVEGKLAAMRQAWIQETALAVEQKREPNLALKQMVINEARRLAAIGRNGR